MPEPEVTFCAYCGEDVIVGEPCTCPHYWPEDAAGEIEYTCPKCYREYDDATQAEIDQWTADGYCCGYCVGHPEGD